ncbi:rabenosyn-5 [Orussus abietinus]|uniref:rabenosyn-5 n=1 Tax=Orussus abietinus TaxID=222816 RepID=UPI0006257B7D|nr:rabenosyn-5 [Orussus abietinus]
MAGSGEVLEGFLCPICMSDLKTPTQLTKHFEEFHHDDPEILKSLKDLFDKAKKKILKQDEIPEAFNDPVIPIDRRTSPDIVWGPQEIGAIQSHTKYFKEMRNIRLARYTLETNKLLIRMDKLLCNLPSDPVDRKVHEQTIVPWIDDKDVKLCPTCARSFHVARRKHHCRLCGAVMCHDCTIFLPLSEARKMTSPVSIQDDTAVSPTSSGSPISGRIVRAGIGLTKLARSPSSGSLNSVLSLVNDPSTGEQHFRLCSPCKEVLDARERLKARQFDRPIICQFYEKMRRYMEEANRYLDMYRRMCQSLNEGESMYDLRDAQVLRVKIAKVGENIDGISKGILVLGSKDVDSAPQGQDLRLRQMVRASAMLFLKEDLLNVPALPTEEEYAALQEKQIEARNAYERQFKIDEVLKDRRQELQVPYQSEGWGPSGAAATLSSTMDPIIEQMNNIQSYIKQARAECKFDEVAMLENNLRELQSEYFTRKQGNSTEEEH